MGIYKHSTALVEKQDMIQHTESSFHGQNNIKLYRQTWRPEAHPRATIALVHGFGEHSGRYKNVVNALVPADYAIYSYDQRGHGKSEGSRGYINNWSEFRDDLHMFLDHVRRETGDSPLFMYGHSMGGLVVLDYLLHHPEATLNGVVLTGPLVGMPGVSPLLVWAGRILNRIKPDFAMEAGLDIAGISSDPAEQQAYKNDSLVHGKSTPRHGMETLKQIDWVQENAGNFTQPLLILHGADDPIVPPVGSELFMKNAGSADKTRHLLPNLRHEVHNEVTHFEVMDKVRRWLDERS
jgi:alpha-beta hydrolase superfamily lysophospholipase